MLIFPYDAKWVQDFKLLRTIIAQALNNDGVVIEHIGSTSVPGMPAKPIIDIDIIYSSELDFGSIQAKLEGIGYFHNGDQGVLNREAFKRNKTSSHEILDHITHHLYVCPDFSKELKRHLLFRNYLRKHAVVREEYAQIKMEIAEESNHNRKEYARIKEIKARNFIEGVIHMAQLADKSVTNSEE